MYLKHLCLPFHQLGVKLVLETGIEPVWLTLTEGFSYCYSFHYHFCLQSGLYLHLQHYLFRCTPSSLYTFLSLGLARYYQVKGFTDFEAFYSLIFGWHSLFRQVPCVCLFRHSSKHGLISTEIMVGSEGFEPPTHSV